MVSLFVGFLDNITLVDTNEKIKSLCFVKNKKVDNDEVRETWKYKGRNRSIDEFTMKFVNGELVSVDQYKESYY